MNDYNYENFSTDEYNFDDSKYMEIGSKALNFELETVDGGYKKILDFSGDYLVLEMGSITCPLFQGRRDSMLKISQDFDNVSFVVLYIREAHPGSFIKSHTNYNDKKICATKLKNVDNEKREIFIDNFDGDAHKSYGSMPDSVFIIDKNKNIVFRLDWNNPILVRNAINSLLNNKTVSTKSFFYPVSPFPALKVLNNAGKGSAKDFFSSLPFLIWTNVIKRNLRELFRKK